jgi:lysophospholipase L1-like esterase
MKHAVWILWSFFVTLSFVPQALTAESPHDFAKWENDISAFENIDRTNPPTKGGLLFIGSSTIKLWKSLPQDFPKHHVINRGFGGSEIVDSTHFAERIIFPYQPRMVFLRAGGNDLWAGKSSEQVFADFKDFVQKMHEKLPQTQVLFISLSPSIARLKQADKEKAVNAMVKSYAATDSKTKYIDAWSVPLGKDGQPSAEFFLPDNLHFNEAGYKRLVERVRPYVPANE